MDLSIIIINFNSSNYTIDCVKSIYKYTEGLTFEIIVVDNYSTKESTAELKTFLASKNIQFIESKKNLGFGGGNMLGYQFSSGQYLAFFNNDTELTENSFLKTINFIKSDTTIGTVGINQVDEDGKGFKYTYRQFVGLKYHLLGLPSPQKFYGKNNDLTKPFEVDAVSGAYMFFDATVFKKVGGFDPNIFLFYEEMDICYRMKQLGYKTMFLPTSTFSHFQGKSSTSIILKREFIISYLYVIQKNYSYPYYFAMKCILLMKYGIKSIFKPKKYFNAFLLVFKGGNSLVYSIKP